MEIRTLEELMYRARLLPHEETRRDSEDYLELVATRETLEQLMPIFDNFFGAPLKPPGRPPCERSIKHAEPFGGIDDGQTLYLTTRQQERGMAMIWPWNDGQRATVKIAQSL